MHIFFEHQDDIACACHSFWCKRQRSEQDKTPAGMGLPFGQGNWRAPRVCTTYIRQRCAVKKLRRLRSGAGVRAVVDRMLRVLSQEGTLEQKTQGLSLLGCGH